MCSEMSDENCTYEGGRREESNLIERKDMCRMLYAERLCRMYCNGHVGWSPRWWRRISVSVTTTVCAMETSMTRSCCGSWWGTWETAGLQGWVAVVAFLSCIFQRQLIRLRQCMGSFFQDPYDPRQTAILWQPCPLRKLSRLGEWMELNGKSHPLGDPTWFYFVALVTCALSYFGVTYWKSTHWLGMLKNQGWGKQQAEVKTIQGKALVFFLKGFHQMKLVNVWVFWAGWWAFFRPCSILPSSSHTRHQLLHCHTDR